MRRMHGCVYLTLYVPFLLVFCINIHRSALCNERFNSQFSLSIDAGLGRNVSHAAKKWRQSVAEVSNDSRTWSFRVSFTFSFGFSFGFDSFSCQNRCQMRRMNSCLRHPLILFLQTNSTLRRYSQSNATRQKVQSGYNQWNNFSEW
jgi:hypothetical protein